ncbi:hypothetical protein D6817_00560 [Candidatus Pacearchaeota archaeon]|nr:MAG: hypothetical protein D6817_00560 [Candidatus Pacearchaeota archaeon]
MRSFNFREFDWSEFGDSLSRVRGLAHSAQRGIYYENLLRELSGEEKRAFYAHMPEVLLDICEDRAFCRRFGIDYANLRGEDVELLRIALADFFVHQVLGLCASAREVGYN